MNTYELVVIFRSSLEEKKDALLAKLQDTVKPTQATISQPEWWGKKMLAYPIAKENDGLYFSCVIESTGGNIEKVIGAYVKNDPQVLRFLLMRKEKSSKKS